MASSDKHQEDADMAEADEQAHSAGQSAAAATGADAQMADPPEVS